MMFRWLKKRYVSPWISTVTTSPPLLGVTFFLAMVMLPVPGMGTSDKEVKSLPGIQAMVTKKGISYCKFREL
jgi:hypothetical protein